MYRVRPPMSRHRARPHRLAKDDEQTRPSSPPLHPVRGT